jgi:plastocyanin
VEVSVKKVAALSVALIAAFATACAGHSNGDGNSATSYAFPGMPGMRFTAKLPSPGASPLNVHSGPLYLELPQDGLGTVKDKYWHGTFGHFSHHNYSQAIGFPPGTLVTIQNIDVSDDVEHTLNVVGKIDGPPAKFPRHPNLSLSASGGKLEKGYASGIIYPGSSVTVKLGKKGIYLLGCAFHYLQGMKDVIVVEPGATPGPQGTPPPVR